MTLSFVGNFPPLGDIGCQRLKTCRYCFAVGTDSLFNLTAATMASINHHIHTLRRHWIMQNSFGFIPTLEHFYPKIDPSSKLWRTREISAALQLMCRQQMISLGNGNPHTIIYSRQEQQHEANENTAWQQLKLLKRFNRAFLVGPENR